MKKTIKINLSGIIFHFDEDAYELLSSYLERIHSHFNKSEGGSEIISDIELRMAELFQSKLSESKQVITVEDVREVIKNMGDPEDFSVEQENETASSPSTKKLYRDPDNAIIGGVSAGLGAYFNIDPVWIRLILVLLMLAYGLVGVLYILLWIFTPRAETYSQKLEMKGENITISNIEKNVRKEYEDVKGNFQKFQHSEPYKNFTHALNEIFQVLGKILKISFQILLILIGGTFIVAGITAILSLMGVILIDFPVNLTEFFNFNDFPLQLFLKSFLQPVSLSLTMIALLVVIAIPILFVIYVGVKLLTHFKANDRAILLTALFVWIAALVYVPGNILWQFRHLGLTASTVEEKILDVPGTGNLMLEIDHSRAPEYYLGGTWMDEDSQEAYGMDEKGNIYLRPAISVNQSADENYRVVIKKFSRGKSFENASLWAKNIYYEWHMTDSSLSVGGHFMIPPEYNYRMQHVRVLISVPEGKKITPGEESEIYLENVRTEPYMRKSKIGAEVWEWPLDY